LQIFLHYDRSALAVGEGVNVRPLIARKSFLPIAARTMESAA
jgi:hypothetical protein